MDLEGRRVGLGEAKGVIPRLALDPRRGDLRGLVPTRGVEEWRMGELAPEEGAVRMLRGLGRRRR